MASLHCAGPASLRRARAFSSFRISYEAHFSGAYGLVAAPTSLASSSLRRGRTTVGAAVLQHQDDATLFYPHGLKSLTPGA